MFSYNGIKMFSYNGIKMFSYNGIKTFLPEELNLSHHWHCLSQCKKIVLYTVL